MRACSHPNVQTTTGPTTDQNSHWCPDCRCAWTTWPAEDNVSHLTPSDFGIDNSPSPGGPIPRSDYDAGCGTAPDGAYYCNCGECT